MTRRERREKRESGVDDDAKWPGAVRIALLACGIAGSWALLWLVGRAIVRLFG